MRSIKILCFVLLFLGFGGVLAQSGVVISLPIHGTLAVQGGLVGSNISQLLLVDTT